MSDAVLKPVLKSYVATILLVTLAAGLVSLLVPTLPVPPALALPVLFVTAMEAGRKFALGTARALTRGERARFSGIAAGLQVGIGVLALGLLLATERQAIVAIHPLGIALVLALTAMGGFAITYAGLGFGATRALRKRAG